MIIIIIKAQFEIFLQTPHCTTNCLQHVRSRGPDAIVCKSLHKTLDIDRNSRCQILA